MTNCLYSKCLELFFLGHKIEVGETESDDMSMFSIHSQTLCEYQDNYTPMNGNESRLHYRAAS